MQSTEFDFLLVAIEISPKDFPVGEFIELAHRDRNDLLQQQF